MKRDEEFEAAEQRLHAAGEALGTAVEARLSREAVLIDAEAEIQRMTADRGRLARELDTALARGQRLERANREVSKRLVDAMERVRQVLAPRED
ncbi:MAG: DUF4164 family protein [Fulvimarina manganoxydans]|uniref:DUF4164 family protein n=1 Tax=Fulvimarina manganoxydans TaxID=937218 RepID=UPI0023540338|nr:DUF4164 family protein [Fulvimarina manganoxydans]MCK5931103.1 DUF4164 family protein [Fulvimarina manganoxydans]